MRRAAFYDWSLAMPLRRNRGKAAPTRDQKTRTALRKARLQLANWQKRRQRATSYQKRAETRMKSLERRIKTLAAKCEQA